jgi:hypothetical protein
MTTVRVLFWVVPVLLLAVLATQTRCFGQDLRCVPGDHRPPGECTISGTPASSLPSGDGGEVLVEVNQAIGLFCPEGLAAAPSGCACMDRKTGIISGAPVACQKPSLPSGYRVDETPLMCTTDHPCITDDEGPTQVELAYMCGASNAVHRLQAIARPRRGLKPEPEQCRKLNEQYGDDIQFGKDH